LILIATNARDLTSDFVALALEDRGLPFVRLNTETLASGHIIFRPSRGEDGWTIELGEKTISLENVTAAYLRRPEQPIPLQGAGNVASKLYRAEEWSAVLVSALRSIGSRWLNSPTAILQAENKPKQLAVALSLGLRVPDTMVTNAPDVIREFVAQGASVAKPLSANLVGEGDSERVIFTTRIGLDDLTDLAGVEAAPIIIQREIKKRCDLRVTVVGDKVFAAEIHSQDFRETTVDWRKGTRLDLTHRVHVLPTFIAEKCVAITKSFGLRFSAIDLVLSPDEDYWFLEMNPNGQWAWIECRTGLPISAAIADELEGISGC
jgi:glutathione synthase/RimK-type ligase-like ATP-grasp enzyme